MTQLTCSDYILAFWLVLVNNMSRVIQRSYPPIAAVPAHAPGLAGVATDVTQQHQYHCLVVHQISGLI
jgi:hypothetical protein